MPAVHKQIFALRAAIRTSSCPINCPEMLVMSVCGHEEQKTANTQFAAVHCLLTCTLLTDFLAISFFLKIFLILCSCQLLSMSPVGEKLLKDFLNVMDSCYSFEELDVAAPTWLARRIFGTFRFPPENFRFFPDLLGNFPFFLQFLNFFSIFGPIFFHISFFLFLFIQSAVTRCPRPPSDGGNVSAKDSPN